MDQTHCLRCPIAPLHRLEPQNLDIAFFECPACGRHYARKPGKALTFRWGHPISLALYDVIFEDRPAEAEKVTSVAVSLMTGRSPDQISDFVREIRLELSEPTQVVRDILDCRASEQQLRLFLQLLCDRVQKNLDGKDH